MSNKETKTKLDHLKQPIKLGDTVVMTGRYFVNPVLGRVVGFTSQKS